MSKLIKVADLRKKNKGKTIYQYYLLANGKLPRHEVDGYLAYDEEEYAAYCKKAKRGRPLKEDK